MSTSETRNLEKSIGWFLILLVGKAPFAYFWAPSTIVGFPVIEPSAKMSACAVPVWVTLPFE